MEEYIDLDDNEIIDDSAEFVGKFFAENGRVSYYGILLL